MSDGSSDSEIVPEWTCKENDEPTFPGTRAWNIGKANGWKKEEDGVILVGTTPNQRERTFCAACFLETDNVGVHAEVRKGERKGKRSATCMDHEKKLVEAGRIAKQELLKTICSKTRPDFYKRVEMADPRYFVVPNSVSIFKRVKRVEEKTKASTGD